MSKAYIQKPAPSFCGTAVKDGEFVDVKLSDYKGTEIVNKIWSLDE